MKHKHQTILLGAAEELLRAGKIETLDAVYNWVCPDCGLPQRTTRLADTIYALRHAYGWDIATLGDWSSGETLATYTLVKSGDMPGDKSKGPHPRQLVSAKCPWCPGTNGQHSRDCAKATPADAPSPFSIHEYDGKPIPVEAIPSPTKWQCMNCKTVVSKPVGQPMLGGYRVAPCPVCGKPKGQPGRTFAPA